MDDKFSSSRSRKKLFLWMGLSDSIIGGIFLLIWTGLLPVDLSVLDLQRWEVGLVGAVIFFPGIALLTWILSSTREPN